MGEYKICPLSMSCDYRDPLTDCQQEKCAWFDEDARACAVLLMLKSAYIKPEYLMGGSGVVGEWDRRWSR